MKPALFHPTARVVLRSFPDDERCEVGKAIFDLQKDAKLSMPSNWRRAFLIFHAFQKKTAKSPLDPDYQAKALKSAIRCRSVSEVELSSSNQSNIRDRLREQLQSRHKRIRGMF